MNIQIQMLLGLLENCKLCVKLSCLHEIRGMELPHVHLVFNLVTLAKQVNGTMECMLEITSLSEEKKQNKTKDQFIRTQERNEFFSRKS